MSAAQLGAGVLALGGAAMVYMQFTREDPEKLAAMPEDVKRSPLKKTLSNAGLYPQPEAKGKMQRTQSGSMAVFTQGGDGLGGKGNGSM